MNHEPSQQRGWYVLCVLIVSSIIVFLGLTPLHTARSVSAAPENATLTISKSVSEANPELDELFEYTLQYSCSHLTDPTCSNVQIVDQLDGDLIYAGNIPGAHSPSVEFNSTNNTITFTFASLASGTTGEVRVQARIPLWASAGNGDQISNTATINATDAPSTVQSNTVPVTVTWGTTPAEVSKYGNATSPVDATYRWMIGIQPNSAPVFNAVVTDTLPAGITYVGCGSDVGSISCTYNPVSRVVTWTVGSTVYDWVDMWLDVQHPSANYSIGDWVVNYVCLRGENLGNPFGEIGCDDGWVQIANPAPAMDMVKWTWLATDIWGSDVVQVGQEMASILRVSSTGDLPLTDLYFEDHLPSELTFTRLETGNFNYITMPLSIQYELNDSGTWITIPDSVYDGGAIDPSTSEEITRAELGVSESDVVSAFRWNFGNVPVDFARDDANMVIYADVNNTATLGATVQNCADASSNSGAATDLHCDTITIDSTPVAALESSKWVKGTDVPTNTVNSDVCELTADGYTRYPCTAVTMPGGTSDYRLQVQNVGTVTMTNIVVYDILPHIGDTGVLITGTRDTQWRPNLVGAVTVPAGVIVYYSQSSNPCRPELGAYAGCVNDWTTSIPGDPTTVQSLKFDFGSLILDPNDEFELAWPMRAPVDAPTSNEVAWNSFAYRGWRGDSGAALLPAEPPKVGIMVQPIDPATYGNFVWDDTNRDGIQDGGEAGLDGVRVELYRDNGDGVRNAADTLAAFTVTANGGQYLFPDLPPGDYYAVFYPPATYVISPVDAGSDDTADSDGAPTMWNGFDVAITPITTLTALEEDDTWDLGLNQPNPVVAAVGNYVWSDSDSDGVQDESTANGINGVTVELYNSGSVLISTTTTTNDIYGNPGFYLFDNLTPGDYYLDFSLPVSATFTTRGATGSSDAADSDPDPTNGQTETFTLVGGSYDDTWDAGIVMPTGNLTLGNRVWYDTDDDALYESADGEQGINGVVVNLYVDTDGNGSYTPGVDGFFATATTFTKAGEPGYYEFTDLPANDYIVQIAPSNFESGGALEGMSSSAGVTPDPDSADTDHDDNGEPVANHGVVSYAVTLATGTEPITDGDSDNNTNMAVDFGFVTYVKFGNRVWYEDDGDGNAATGNVTPISNTVVTAVRSDGMVLTTTTDANGLYTFTVSPNDVYTVTVSMPTGYVSAIPTGGLDATENDPLTNNNTSHNSNGTVLTLGSVDNLTLDFGFTDPAAIGDYIWYDADNDGVQDAAEQGIPNVLVGLYDSTCTTLIASQYTNANGGYLFDGLTAGDFCVQIIDDRGELTGMTATSGPQVHTGGTITVSAGERYTDADFGYVVNAAPDAVLGDTVWFDANGNGVQEPSEIGIPGVTITATNGVTVYTTTTDESGRYLFTLPPGTYSVYVDTSTLPAGLTQTYDLDEGLDHMTSGIVLASGDQFLDADFGYTSVSLGRIGDQVWFDTNNNGVFDSGSENGVPGVTVELIHDTDGSGTWTPGDSFVATVATDADGTYSFEGLPADDYLVLVSDLNRVLLGYTFANPGGSPGSNNNNQVQPYAITLSSGSMENLTADFGYVRLTIFGGPTGAIGNQVWVDNNTNGVFDPLTEDGLAGVVVELWQSGALVMTTTTNSEGQYLFSDLPAGTYQVRVSDDHATLNDYSLSVLGSTPGADNNNQGQPYTIVLGSGEINLTADFGYIYPREATAVTLSGAGLALNVQWLLLASALSLLLGSVLLWRNKPVV